MATSSLEKTAKANTPVKQKGKNSKTATSRNGGSGGGHSEPMLATLLEAFRAVKAGDFSVRMPVVKDGGIMEEIARSTLR